MIEDLEYHDLNGEPIWDGVVTVGKDRAELQIEAPKSGPSDAQNEILAELIRDHVVHRRGIFTAVTAVLQSRGIPKEKISEDRMEISIVSVSSAEKKAPLVLIVDLKLTGLLGKSYSLQADLIGRAAYTASIIE